MPTDPTAIDVAADMERIFKPLAGRALVPAFHHDRDIRGQRGRASLGWRRGLLAAPAAILLVTAALVIGYGTDEKPVLRAAGVTGRASLPPASVRLPGTSSSDFSRLPTSTAQAMLVDVADATSRFAIDPRLAADLVSPPRRPTAANPLSAPALNSRPIAVARPAPPVRRPRAVPVDATSDTAGLRRERVEPRCAPDSLEDRCIYQDVMEADARLRSAYYGARRDGVPRSVLSDITRQWRRAQRDADDQPDRTIERYEQLADALDEERRVITQ